MSCHNKCPLQRGLCACFVVSRITRSPPICAWPGACRAGRARDRGLNCPSWCVEGFRIGVSQGDLSGRGRAVGLQSRPLDLRSRTLCANPVCGSFVSPRPWKTGWEAEERRATLRAGGRKTGTARSVLYLMRQRTLAAAAPASAGDGGRPTQRKQAPQRSRSRAVCARTSAEGAGARSAGGRASASTSAKGADARSAGGRASARTSAKGANARSAMRRRTSRCRPDWRSSRERHRK